MARIKKFKKHKSKPVNKKSSRFAQFFAVIIVVLFVGSIAGYVGDYYNSSSSQKYGDWTFKQSSDGFWNVKHKTYGNLVFTFLPNEVKDISLSMDIKNLLSKPTQLSVTFDFSEANDSSIDVNGENQARALAQFNIKKFFESKKNILVNDGLTKANSFGARIITCDDATQDRPVIYLKQNTNFNTGENKTTALITLENNCIILSSQDSRDILMSEERLIYGVTNIVE